MNLSENKNTPDQPWNHDNGNGHKLVPPKAPKIPDAIEQIAAMKAQIELLERQVMARGTENNVRSPKGLEIPKVPVPVAKPELGVRIEQTLRNKILSTDELARTVEEPLTKVQAWIKANRKSVADVGTADTAKWVWRVGDEGPSKELQAMVAMLITHVPMTTAELTKVTGARMARVNGVLVEIQRNQDVPIYNTGSDYRGRWYILPPHAKRANLPPKQPKK